MDMNGDCREFVGAAAAAAVDRAQLPRTGRVLLLIDDEIIVVVIVADSTANSLRWQDEDDDAAADASN